MTDDELLEVVIKSTVMLLACIVLNFSVSEVILAHLAACLVLIFSVDWE